MIKRLFLALALMGLTPLVAQAQSAPPLVYGQVPTAAQWRSYFAAKQDYSAAAVVGPGAATTGNLVKWGVYPNVVDGGAPPTFIAGTGITKSGSASCVGGCTFSVSGGGVTPANPAASVGLSAVNGAATTYMRSDAAPALSQAIVPTWSGIHTFTQAPVFTNQSGTRTALGLGTAATATLGQSGAAVPLLNSNNVWGASQRTTSGTVTPSGSTYTPNFDTSQDFAMTLNSATATLANPSTTPVNGQKGVIVINQDATGSRKFTTYGSSYKCPGGCASLSYTATANATDVASYYVLNSTSIILTIGAANVQ